MKKLVLVGYGGHAKSVADSIEGLMQYHIVGYTDMKENPDSEYYYLGTDEVLPSLFREGVQYAFICVGYLGKTKVRDGLYETLKNIGFSLPSIVDPSAITAKSAVIQEGTWIGKSAVVNAACRIGKMCIINSGAVIDHDNVIGDFSHIAVGSNLCGEVSVGDHTLVGAGTTIIQSCKIGNACIIGAGSTVLRDVDNNSIVVGVYK